MQLFGIEVPLWLILIFGILFAYYKYMTLHFDAFKNTPGLKGPKPLPIFGNMLPILRNGLFGYDKKLIAEYGKLVPTFMGRTPSLVVADEEILKEILIKQFDNFNERAPIMVNPPIDEILTFSSGEKWSNLRNILSPTFSAEKLKRLTKPINKCCETLVQNIRTEGSKPIDVRGMLGAFTMDTIASTAFGLEIDSQADKNNAFVRMANKAFSDNLFNPWAFFSFFAPFVVKLFKLSVMPEDAVQFFVKTVERTIATRTADDRSRTDFIQLMINARQDNAQSKSKRTLTDSEIVAQGILFFVGGFDTVANACSIILHCLATNPEVQKEFYEEIKKTLKSDESPGYDSINQMHFLEMVINESLRIHPALPRLDRRAKRDVTINGVFIPKGTLIQIPVEYFNHNPDIYPDPEKFDPYRFTEEAKAELNPIHFQPFGVGPRHCVAMRLALVEIKMAMVHIIKNFEVKTCSETSIPLKRNGFNGRPFGLKLVFDKRD